MSKSEGHYLVTRFYNVYLNEFLAKYSDPVVIGKIKAGNFDIYLRSNANPNLIYYASLIQSLREDLVNASDDYFLEELKHLLKIYVKVRKDFPELGQEEKIKVKTELIPVLESLFKKIDAGYKTNFSNELNTRMLNSDELDIPISKPDRIVTNVFTEGYGEDLLSKKRTTERNRPPNAKQTNKNKVVKTTSSVDPNICKVCYNTVNSKIPSVATCHYCKENYCSFHEIIENHQCIRLKSTIRPVTDNSTNNLKEQTIIEKIVNRINKILKT